MATRAKEFAAAARLTYGGSGVEVAYGRSSAAPNDGNMFGALRMLDDDGELIEDMAEEETAITNDEVLDEAVAKAVDDHNV